MAMLGSVRLNRKNCSSTHLAEVELSVFRLIDTLNLQQRSVAVLAAHGALVAHDNGAGVQPA